ncbi:MAG: MerR family transcriptional regulator, partial [Halobacteriota archaeon]|nr:MerR family transcriptional regulator [Halobacteriota archaeon]
MPVDQIPIGKFSLITRLSQKALRLYDKKGLLVPEIKDTFTGYRYYTISQIERGIKIKTLSWMGFTLDEIAELLTAEKEEEYGTIEAIVQKQISKIRLEIDRLRKIEEILLTQNGRFEVFDMSDTDPVIKEVPELRVISKREKGTYQETTGKLIGELMGFIFHPENMRNRLKITGPVMMLCHDEDYKEEDADIEIAIPISGRITVEDDSIEVKNLQGCKVLSVVHKGPYHNINLSYSKIQKYATENNLTLVGPDRELYFNSPEEVKEEDLMT